MQDIFPLFKFLTKENSRKLLRKGDIRISTLYEFRNTEKYGGKIADKDEGKKRITHKIKDGKFTADELGELGILFQGSGNVHIQNCTVHSNQESPNCYLYSTSKAFFTDSLFQAIDDKKNSCVLITNPALFFEKISEKLKDSEYKGYYECLYSGREFEVQTMDKKEPIVDLHPIVLKPPEYKDQMEVRAIWGPKNDIEITPQILEIPELSDLCIEVNFDNLDINLLKECKDENREYRIRYCIHKKEKKSAYFDIKYPFEIFTPVIIEHKPDRSLLGFLPQTQKTRTSKKTVSNAEIGIMASHIGSLFCCNYLDEIEKISFFTVEEKL